MDKCEMIHEEIQNRIDDAIQHDKPALSEIAPNEIDNLEQNLNIYHSELIYQNEELKRVNLDLQAVERRYEELFDLAPVAYLVFDSEGRILSVNRAICTLLGREKRKICGSKLSDYLSPKSQDSYYFFLRELGRSKKKRKKKEFFFLSDGHEISTEIFVNQFEEDGLPFYRATVIDLTETQFLVNQLHQEKVRYQVIAEQSNDVLFEYQVKSDVMSYSTRYRELTGNNTVVTNFIQTSLEDGHIHQEDIPLFLSFFEQIKAKQRYLHSDLRVRGAGRPFVWYRVVGTVLYEEDQPVRVVGAITNIDQEVREREELIKAAQMDSLTNLLNKETIQKSIESFLHAEGTKGCHALLVIDIDNFKMINDNLGHLFGDAVLTEISAKLTSVMQPRDLCGRIGGDEFVMLLKNRTREEATEIAQTICRNIKSVFLNQREDCSVSSSLGICMFPDDAATYLDMFRKADAALYGAKIGGKNGFRFYGDVTVQGVLGGELMNCYNDADPYEDRRYANVLLVTNIIELLFAGKDLDSSITLILSILGSYYNVSHACLIEDFPEQGCCKMTYEWYSHEGDCRMASLNSFSRGSLQNYSRLFNSDGLFCCYDMSLVGYADEDLWKRARDAGVQTSLQCALSNGDVFHGFISLDDFDSSRKWNQEDINSYMLVGKTIGVYLIKLRMQQRSERYANLDSLTNVLNINKFTEVAAEYLKWNMGCYALASVDIRNFKYFNDRLGYAEGDEILIAFSQRLSAALEPEEMIARVSADQFVLLLSYQDLDVFQDRLRTFLDSLGTLTLDSAHFYKLSVAVGVYLIKPEELVLSTIMDRANLARKSAKSTHKSMICYYDQAMENAETQEKFIENNMEEALAANEFYVVYQPKFSLQTGKINGAEALIRWKSIAGPLSPDQFIPAVEKNGFIVELDLFVLDRVCQALSQWEKQGRELCIAVNFSRTHVSYQESLPRVLETVEKWGVSPRHLEIEITESAFIDDDLGLRDYVNKLRAIGFSIAMDDFGSGYSSLGLLKDLEVDVIKLDREFLGRDHLTPRGCVVVENIVRMAHQLGMSIVAEGVETGQQSDFLQGIGCETVQGFLFAKPMTLEYFNQLLKE